MKFFIFAGLKTNLGYFTGCKTYFSQTTNTKYELMSKSYLFIHFHLCRILTIEKTTLAIANMHVFT